MLAAAGHEVRAFGASGPTAAGRSGPEIACRLPWRRVDAVVAPPLGLPARALVGRHALVVDGAAPPVADGHRRAAAAIRLIAARADAVLVAGSAQEAWWRARLGRRRVPLLQVPWGVPDRAPADDRADLEGVPASWPVVLWWGGGAPGLDLETLLAARARLGGRPLSLVVPTSSAPDDDEGLWSTARLRRAMASLELSPPQVVPLECSRGGAERVPVLRRAAVVALLHHPGETAELCFRAPALDALWVGVPLLVSEGGAVSDEVRTAGWGAVVPPGDPRAAAAALDHLLGERGRWRVEQAMARDRDRWRWREVAQPLVLALPRLPVVRRGSLVAAALRTAAALAPGGSAPEGSG